MKSIVVFYGSKGVGKDTCFDMLEKLCFFGAGKTIQKIFFADYLKEVVWDLFRTKIKNKERIWGSIDMKEEPIEDWIIPENIRTSCGFKETVWTGRRLLQWFGTDVCRNVHDNIWVDSLVTTIKNKSVITDVFGVTDCRFFNEYDVLKSLKGQYKVIFVHVNRNLGNNEFSGHASEVDMSKFQCDVELDNNGSLEELKEKIQQFYKIHLV